MQMKSKINSMYEYSKTDLEEETLARVELKAFERSSRLSEIRAVYKSRTRVEARTKIHGPESVTKFLRAIWNQRTLELPFRTSRSEYLRFSGPWSAQAS